MGTKLQSNSSFRDQYHPRKYPEGSPKENGGRPLHQENRNGNNNNNPGVFLLSPMRKNGHNTEKMRNIILEQESVFKHQLQELHNLYRRQREVMNELQRKETEENGPKEDKTQMRNGSWFSSFAPPSSNVGHRSSNALELNLLPINRAEDLGVNRIQANGFKASKNPFRSSLGGFESGKERLSDDHADGFSIGGLFSDNSTIFSNAPRLELFKSPILGTKRKIFGVEIFEGNGAVSSNVSVEGGLPWFLRDSRSNAKTNSYFMNLDSLQNSSPNFFKRAEAFSDKIIQNSKRRTQVDDSGNAKKIPGNIPVSEENPSETKDGESGSRQYIDLNLSLDEESDASPPRFPTSTVITAAAAAAAAKIGSLEASSAATDSSHAKAEGKSRDEETDNIAVDALISISEGNLKTVLIKDKDGGDRVESCLKWLADIVSTGKEEEEEGMDYLELMTLNLEDAKNNNYLYDPTLSLHKKPNYDEIGDNNITSSASKRPRRRGTCRQQRNDFQRDVLPGLVTLSRIQVTEDLQGFEELKNNAREGGNKVIRSSRKNYGKVVRKGLRRFDDDDDDDDDDVEEGRERRSLACWGKRTRRLPRQRCFATGILSQHAVKC